MKKSKKFLEKISKEKSKRIYHIKYNYLKLEEIRKIIEKLEKSKEDYKIKLKYDDEILKNSNLYQIEDIEILEIMSYFDKDFSQYILAIPEYTRIMEQLKTISEIFEEQK